MSTVSSVEAIEALARRLHEPLGELFGAATCADACWEQEGIVHRVTVQVRMVYAAFVRVWCGACVERWSKLHCCATAAALGAVAAR